MTLQCETPGIHWWRYESGVDDGGSGGGGGGGGDGGQRARRRGTKARTGAGNENGRGSEGCGGGNGEGCSRSGMNREAKRVISREVCIARISSRALFFFSSSRLIFPCRSVIRNAPKHGRARYLKEYLVCFYSSHSEAIRFFRISIPATGNPFPHLIYACVIFLYSRFVKRKTRSMFV